MIWYRLFQAVPLEGLVERLELLYYVSHMLVPNIEFPLARRSFYNV